MLLPFANSIPVDEGINEVQSWESMQSIIKSGTRSIIRYAMPTVIRGLSTVNVSKDCELSLLKFTIDITKLKAWAVKSKFSFW